VDQFGSSILVTPHASVNVVKKLQRPNHKVLLAKEIFEDVCMFLLSSAVRSCVYFHNPAGY